MNMILNGFWPVFLYGFIGGALAEIVGWFELRTTKPSDFPAYVRYWYYWFLTFIMCAIGGFLATAYGIVEVKVMLALNIGASAPLILKGLARALPPQK
jgi:hypothetical protein